MAGGRVEQIDPSEAIIIGLDTDHGPEHVLFDERAKLDPPEWLINSILTNGVITPCLGRKEGGKWHIVDGRQRCKAARIAHERATATAGDQFGIKLPIMQIHMAAEDLPSAVAFLNELRVNDDILTKAQKCLRMFNRSAGDVKLCERSFGRQEATIRGWLSLAAAASEILDAVRTARIPAASGIELSRLPLADQVAALHNLLDRSSRPGTGPVKPTESSTQGAQAQGATPLDQLGADPSEEPASTPPASPPPRQARAEVRHDGVKRTWLRKALKTERAKLLSDDERGVLVWFATGEADKGTWFDDFQFEAGSEMSGAPPAKRGRRKKTE